MAESFRIELDKKWWAEFRRQVRIATGSLKDVSDMLQDAAKPMAEDWSRRLPGSIGPTVRQMRQSRQAVIRAGWKSPHGDHPHAPWVEFGGTVKWYGSHGDPYTRVPIGGEVRSRKIIYIKRSRVPEGRYLGPAFRGKRDEVNRKLAEGIQNLLCRVFHAPA